MTTSTTRSQAFTDINDDINATLDKILTEGHMIRRKDEYLAERAGMIMQGIVKCLLNRTLSDSEAQILADRVADDIWEF